MDEDDLADVCRIRNECIDMLHGEIRTLEQTKEWFNKEHPMWFVIKKIETIDVYDESCAPGTTKYKKLQKTVGYFRTKLEDSSYYNVDIQIGCDIHPDYRRQGIAEWTYKNMIERLVNNYYTPVLYVLIENQPAINLYKKIGFSSLAKLELRRNNLGLHYTDNQNDWQIINYNGKPSYYMKYTK